MSLSFSYIIKHFHCKEIRGCPGRYIIKDLFDGSLFENLHIEEFISPKACDPVVAARIEGGGLISFKKGENIYLHTLNTPAGFERKMAMLEIKLSRS